MNKEEWTHVDLAELAKPRPSLTGGASVDPVTAEVIRGTMETICFEMAVYVSRTATTPILNQSNERNASLLDRNGRIAAVSVGIPQLMLASSLPVRFAADFFGDDIRPGDVFLANDPWGNQDIKVHVKVTIDGSRLAVDFSGSDDRQELHAWSSYGNTRAYTISQLAAGVEIRGPALIEEPFTVVVLGPDYRARHDEHGNYEVTFP